MQFDAFKAGIIKFILDVLFGLDGTINDLQQTITALQSENTGLLETNATLIAKIEELNRLLAADEQADLTEINTVADEIRAAIELRNSTPVEEPNPTVATDAFIQAVEETKLIETPPEVEETTTVNEPVATEPVVAEAAVEAVFEAIAGESAE